MSNSRAKLLLKQHKITLFACTRVTARSLHSRERVHEKAWAESCGCRARCSTLSPFGCDDKSSESGEAGSGPREYVRLRLAVKCCEKFVSHVKGIENSNVKTATPLCVLAGTTPYLVSRNVGGYVLVAMGTLSHLGKRKGRQSEELGAQTRETRKMAAAAAFAFSKGSPSAPCTVWGGSASLIGSVSVAFSLKIPSKGDVDVKWTSIAPAISGTQLADLIEDTCTQLARLSRHLVCLADHGRVGTFTPRPQLEHPRYPRTDETDEPSRSRLGSVPYKYSQVQVRARRRNRGDGCTGGCT
ncbi:hypothetical protein B0T20DRAFT_471839 [Sordaria brevicollis]|uniref:Uncharacterized protein n=1 Tax=Sordaria brevicollis TaxID=83679 RepID=A0AAE0P9D3_SORBR|nr:hypothetical protein B0T20DRAFT_471839 [Sordaria brevicollis]